jgi:hypothetical protein
MAEPPGIAAGTPVGVTSKPADANWDSVRAWIDFYLNYILEKRPA